jgi:16S rRNA (adenine1518-N6/adenine1519-N6)-dimethyltransferase
MTTRNEDPLDPRALLRKYELSPKRAFSQNFLIQRGAVEQIAEAAASLGPTVVELGPGLGTLTAALLHRGRQVVGIELDRDMIRVLRAEYGTNEALRLIQADAAKVDFTALSEELGTSLVVTGNLPYQATGAILRQVVAHRAVMRGAVLMVQREVRDRLVALPGSKDYGALTVFTQAGFEIDTLLRLRPGAFFPAPQVDSAVVRLRPLSTARAEETPSFRKLVRAAFQMRRKTLRNALRSLANASAVDSALERAGLDGTRRGETLSVEEFAVLAEIWSQQG